MKSTNAAFRAANDNATTLGVIPMQPQSRAITEEIHDALEEAEESSGGRWLAVLVVVSIAAHAALFFALGHRGTRGPAAVRKKPPSEVTVTVAPPKAPPPPVAAPEPKAAPRRLAVKAPPPPAEAKAPPPPPEAETPADFSGTTLTNDGAGPGWASAVGNGAAMHGPIGTPGRKVTGKSHEGAAEPAPRTEAPVVALGSLSRPPEPPDLNDALERHYPEAARRAGTPGQAVLKARITPEGQVRDLVVVSQSAPGFGDACRATLRESHWSAPLDRSGQPVATFVTYTCRFEVR